MARKGKKILWHKKSGKVISSKFAAARGARVTGVPVSEPADRRKEFAVNLKKKIHRAVDEAHKAPLAAGQEDVK